MIHPTVAVLVATYNGEIFLKQQLDSILAQTYQNIKIYISDDKSSDSTVKILFDYQKMYPDKIFYSVNEKNEGFVKNFEKLLQNCSENYISLSDQDDIWIENKLEIQMQEMLKLEELYEKDALLVHSDLSMIDENNKLIRNSYFKYRHYTFNETKDFGQILGPCGVMGNTILMNKKLKNIVLKFPDKLDFHDYWIALNCELFGIRKTLNLQLVQYRVHSSNSSNSQATLEKKQYFKLNRDIKLPNLETNRKYYLPKLYKKIKSSRDVEILEAYMSYLEFKNNKLLTYIHLLQYSLVKKNTLFRITLFFKILFTKRYL
jgi:rhamnosyltransferase